MWNTFSQYRPELSGPPPKVDSAVIRLTPLPLPEAIDIDKFLRFASACFRQKRKTLRNNLAGVLPKDLLDSRPEMSKRAEQLSVAELLDLYRSGFQSSTASS